MTAIIIVNEENARKLWHQLGDVPIDDNECIEEEFQGFSVGTHREDIWYWFEETFGINVHDLMFPNKEE